MPGKIEHRSVSPVLIWLRNFLRGNPDNFYPLRFADLLAARTQPQPEIPGGPNHKLSKVYYYTRDARREVQPPIVITGAKQIGSRVDVAKDAKRLTPATLYVPKE